MKWTSKQIIVGIVAALCLIALPLQAHAKPTKAKASKEAAKERLVLMPIRVPEEDKNLTGAMETALVKGLQHKYDVFSGERVAQKAREIFMKESRNTAHTECDETKCMQNLAMAFQAELIATANVTKQDGSYFLALSIQNIFDNKIVYSESLPCKNCDITQVIQNLKELSGSLNQVADKASSTINNSQSEHENPEDIKTQLALATKYLNGDGVAQDYAKAFQILSRVPFQGNATNQWTIGWMYENGRGVAQDDLKAFEWYQKSAAQGNATAQCTIGMMYTNGQGVAKDESMAVEWFQKSATQGNACGQLALGLMYETGRGVAKDYSKAFEWYQNSAAQGEATAQWNLGQMYANGQGVAKNDSKAFEWTQKSAVQGNAAAQWSLGIMYIQGWGVTKDVSKAYEWYQKSAAQGYAIAQWTVGGMYEEGLGVAKNESKAVEWFQKSAAQGNTLAQQKLKNMGH